MRKETSVIQGLLFFNMPSKKFINIKSKDYEREK